MASSEGSQRNRGDLGSIIDTLASSEVIGSLSNIASLADGLEKNTDAFSPEEAGTLIRLQSERAARLIEGLLVAEQVLSGSRQVFARPVALRPTLEEVIGSLDILSERYATNVRLDRKKKFRPVLADDTLLVPALSAALEGVIRTTISKRIRVDTVSHDDKLFLHIKDKDASMESQEDGAPRQTAGSAHAIAIPSFYVAAKLLSAMGGELRIAAGKDFRHIDLIFPHSIQLQMVL